MRFKQAFFVLVFSVLLKTTLLAQAFVQDEAQLLRAEDRQMIEQISAQVQKQSAVEIAVVTLKSLGDESIEEAAVNLFEKWGIGSKTEDLGLLLLVALEDKKLRIEVGYGLEDLLPDAKVGAIIDRLMLPEFKQGNFSAGIMAGYIEILKVLNQRYVFTFFKPRQESYTQIPQGDAVLLLPFLVLIACLLPFRWGRRLLYYTLLFSMFSSSRRAHHGYGSFGGGGFGGFGGGLSGGAGASRSW